MEPILELQHVTKNFEGFSLNDISLHLEPGYILGCIGPNGSGKTTLIRLIMNLIKADAGSIRLFGTSVADDAHAERDAKDRIGFVYDEPCLYDDILPMVMKDLIRKFYTRWDDQEFSRYFELFELPANKPLKTYSQGMKMKFVTAMALSHHAQLIIMDEPTSGLDPVSRHEILEILQDYINREEASVFFSTHITSDLERIADYICLIHDGKHLFTLPKDDVLQRFRMVRGPLELLETTGDDALQETRLPLVGYSKHAYGFEGLTDDPATVEAQFGKQVVIERCSLDDMMLYMTKRRVGK
jgi:ABC-2 type transport system ATP-binding protein